MADDNSICAAAIRHQGSVHRCQCRGHLACRYGYHSCRECTLSWFNDGGLRLDVMAENDTLWGGDATEQIRLVP